MTERNSNPATSPTRVLGDTRVDGPSPVASTDLACLVFLTGERVGYKLPMHPGRLEIGRDPGCHISLNSDLVSRNHARLIVTAETVLLVDLGSTNGTFVNDRRVRDALLQDGDRVGIGNVLLKYLGPGSAESAYHDEVFRLVTHDGLTEVYNRRYYDDELLQRATTKHAIGLILFDADHFKRINDTFGHAGGDRVLREVSKRVSELLPTTGFLARIGGEEFAVVLSAQDTTQLAATCREVSEQVRAAVANAAVNFGDKEISVSVSVGCAWSAPVQADLPNDQVPAFLTQLVALADSRLYAAKQAGRNRVCSE